MTIKSNIIMMGFFFQAYIASGQRICKRQMTVEWRTEPKSIIVNWTLSRNICSNFYSECWNINISMDKNILEHQGLNVPQICPLQLQLGDSLFISSEPSFQSYGMNLVNVSMEEFVCCSQTGFLHDQLIFGSRLTGIHRVDTQWLSVGTHFFVEATAKGPLLCSMGLRLNITVKQQFCQESPTLPLCSGHGRCLSHMWQEAYNCHCAPQYFGRFCQEFDMCSTKPCYNNGSCTRKGEGLIWDSYECTCPPQFSGKNCSERIGQCEPNVCLQGNCSNVTPNTFLCKCNEGFTGEKCISFLGCIVPFTSDILFVEQQVIHELFMLTEKNFQTVAIELY
uniref:EGF-like domain-containing protein n=1 Tax=Crocodylus porosus TaxID=8502 RepID=A0A7M4F235_CROPO